MSAEDVGRLKLAFRRLASYDEEEAEQFLLFVPPLPTGDSSGLAKLAAAVVVSTIRVATENPLSMTIGIQYFPIGTVSRNLQYRLALVFSRDFFERATSLASVVADLDFLANPEEVADLMLGSPEAVNRFRTFFRELALQIADQAADGEAAIPRKVVSRRARPKPQFAILKAATEAVLVASTKSGKRGLEWRSRKVRLVLTLATATACGRLTVDQAKALLEAEGLVWVATPPRAS